jgi:hypothetical protein
MDHDSRYLFESAYCDWCKTFIRLCARLRDYGHTAICLDCCKDILAAAPNEYTKPDGLAMVVGGQGEFESGYRAGYRAFKVQRGVTLDVVGKDPVVLMPMDDERFFG